ncbi:MAG: cytochrome c oxidase subunit 3 [Candidatus Binatia bacterium]
MARQATARQLYESLSAEEAKARTGGPSDPPPFSGPVVSNARLGLLMLLAAEAMLFAGLIGAFLVFRLSSPNWPPPFQPRLPVLATGVNTLVLLLSGLTMHWASKAARAGNNGSLINFLSVTAALGVLFLIVQGYEWLRLISFGLTVSSGVYGATFYTIIGCHALHVFGAVIWLVAILIQARREKFTPQAHTPVEICAMYWAFVVGLWPLLYGLVYLY